MLATASASAVVSAPASGNGRGYSALARFFPFAHSVAAGIRVVPEIGTVSENRSAFEMTGGNEGGSEEGSGSVFARENHAGNASVAGREIAKGVTSPLENDANGRREDS